MRLDRYHEHSADALYYKGANQQTYGRFETEPLADDPAQLAKFVFMLTAERVLPAGGARCHLVDLLAASERAGRELAKEFYRANSDLRQGLLKNWP